MTDINKIFMKISAKSGYEPAKSALDQERDKNKEELTKIIEFIVMNLQAEIDRISSYTLGKLNTQEIGSQIVLIIEEYINKALYLLEIEKEFDFYLEKFLVEMMNYYKEKIDYEEDTSWINRQISEFNLIHDFHQIADNLKELDLIEKNRLLTYLTMINIKRRIERRLFLPSFEK